MTFTELQMNVSKLKFNDSDCNLFKEYHNAIIRFICK